MIMPLSQPRDRAHRRLATSVCVVMLEPSKPTERAALQGAPRVIGQPRDLCKWEPTGHGGATKIGDTDEENIRAVSGYKTLEVALIHNKATIEKARRIAATISRRSALSMRQVEGSDECYRREASYPSGWGRLV
jgi:hypothetical protein